MNGKSINTGKTLCELFIKVCYIHINTTSIDAGEAVYVDDIPSPRDCLYGAFIYSMKPLAHIKDIKLSLSAQKVVSVVSANDIPKEGSNVGALTVFGPEPLFADSIAEYAGQPIGLVVSSHMNLNHNFIFFKKDIGIIISIFFNAVRIRIIISIF
jgi:xanthine dehydrogenase molybdopterin-binding subunit B